jgi:glucosamine 6-phosphate synthetase-like amidotransferase/phosphosugar isomerase protein
MWWDLPSRGPVMPVLIPTLGPEIGVASTKAFTAQLAVLTMIALKIGYIKGSISQATVYAFAE